MRKGDGRWKPGDWSQKTGRSEPAVKPVAVGVPRFWMEFEQELEPRNFEITEEPGKYTIVSGSCIINTALK